jgi:glycosyltransferase involved in cell wall biosynthesis
MHAGIPVAAPIIGGLRDYASPGLLWPFDAVDPSAIAGAIAAAMDDRAHLAIQVERAAEMIDQRFGGENVRRILSEIGQALIAEARRRAASRAAAGHPASRLPA